MKMNFVISLALLLIAISSYAQDSTQLKRTPYKLIVQVDKKNVYEEDINATPYVMPNKAVQIYPGETIFLEIEQVNGKILSVTAVPEIKNPSKTVTLSFTQTAKKKVHELMMLKVVNPFSYTLVYKAVMSVLPQKKWVETDVYPVMPGLSGFETWPYVITSLGLGDWELKAK
ncbi:MAG: hypothetical protein V4722_04185 [Bacteroidota bacterium]